MSRADLVRESEARLIGLRMARIGYDLDTLSGVRDVCLSSMLSDGTITMRPKVMYASSKGIYGPVLGEALEQKRGQAFMEEMAAMFPPRPLTFWQRVRGWFR